MFQLAIAVCLSLALVAAEPPAVAKVLADVARAEEAANRVYEASLAKAKEKAIGELVKIQDGLTKKGDLDGALLVREKIAELSADVDLLGNPVKTMTLASADALAKRIAAGAITADDYEKMGGREVTVDARAVLETKIVLGKGERYLVFPHPNDTWAAAASGFHGEKVNYQGRPGTDERIVEAAMSLVIRVGENIVPGYLAAGEGPILLSPKDSGLPDNVGAVRVKLVKIR